MGRTAAASPAASWNTDRSRTLWTFIRRALNLSLLTDRRRVLGNLAINTILPLFAIMVAGYFTGRFKLLPAGASEVLSRFVFVIALPALILASLSSITIAEFFNWRYIGALGGGMLAMFCLGITVARYLFPGNLTALSLHGLTAMYSSTGYIGLPLVLTVFGDAGRAPGIIGAIITGLVFAPLAIILAEIDRNQGSRFRVWPPLLTAFTRPPVIAVVAGLSISAAGVDVPLPFTTFFELLGGAFVPCALFAAGLFIAGCSVRGATAEISWLICAKLILHPLITWWLAYRVFELEGILPVVAVVQAALPSGVPVFVLAQHYRTFVTRSSAAIVLSTAISVLTLSALFMFLSP